MNVKDKVVIITGGGRGIGFGISAAYAKAGAKLVITGRTESTLLEAKEKLEAYGTSVLTVTADGADEPPSKTSSPKRWKLTGKSTSSSITRRLPNRAKCSSIIPGRFRPRHLFGALRDVLLYARSLPSSERNEGLRHQFRFRRGACGQNRPISYAAAKEGIRGLSRVAATEWGPYGVRVNVICPLAMTEGLQKFKEEYPDRYEQTIKAVPMGRFADPEKDIGRLCVFLSSEDASYITGETITVQGGSGLRP